MTTQADPYSRVYWRFSDEFPDIFSDDRALATWLRLLIIAEGAHPSLPFLPAKVGRTPLTSLIDAELVQLLPGGKYRVRGLVKERQKRSDAGRTGGLASARSRAPSTPVERPLTERSTTVEPSKAETSRDEQRQDETRKEARATPPMPVKGMDGSVTDVPITDDPIPVDVRRLQKLAEELTQQPYVMANVHGSYGLKAVTEQLPHGYTRVETTWRKIAAQVAAAGTSRPTLRQLVLGADDILNPVPHADAGEQRSKDAQAAFDRRVKRTQEYIRDLKGETA